MTDFLRALGIILLGISIIILAALVGDLKKRVEVLESPALSVNK